MSIDITMAAAAAQRLPPRQRQVLTCLAQGMLRKEIAAELNISVRTADCHCEHLFQSLNINNGREAVRVAVAAGLV